MKNKNLINSELQSGLHTIELVIQRESLPSEIQRVESGKPSKRLGKLSPFLVDGALRVGGRFVKSQMPFDANINIFSPDIHSQI